MTREVFQELRPEHLNRDIIVRLLQEFSVGAKSIDYLEKKLWEEFPSPVTTGVAINGICQSLERRNIVEQLEADQYRLTGLGREILDFIPTPEFKFAQRVSNLIGIDL